MILSRSVRFIHWGIAITVILNLPIFKDGEFFHRYLGYAAILLVVIRMMYGLVTKNHRQLPMKNIFIRLAKVREMINNKF